MSCELNNSVEMIAFQAQIFDDVRPAGARLFLLKKAGHSGTRFVVVREIESGWFTTFDREFRDEMKAMIATADPIGDDVAQSSFLAYGFGTTGSEIDVFEFERKDTFPPSATSPNWKIHTKRVADKRFTIPATAENDDDDMKLSTTTISVESLNKQNLFTVPTGKKCLVILNNVRGGNSNMVDAGSLSFGFDSEASDFGTMTTGQTRSLLNEDSVASLPPNTSVFSVGSAGQIFGCKFSGGETSGSNSLQVDVIGYLVDA